MSMFDSLKKAKLGNKTQDNLEDKMEQKAEQVTEQVTEQPENPTSKMITNLSEVENKTGTNIKGTELEKKDEKFFDPETNELVKDIQLPEAPPLDASPEQVLKHMFDKMDAYANHMPGQRNTLAEIHTHLQEHNSYILDPDQLNKITQVTQNLTAFKHSSAQAKKTKSQARVAKSETKKENVSKVSDDLGDIF